MKALRAAWFVFAVVSILAGTWSGAAEAQQTDARITGTVRDSSGAVLPGVTVTVTSAQTGSTRLAVTEGDGAFSITNLSPGAYVVKTQLDGFGTDERTVTLAIGDVKHVDVSLGVASLTEAVTVTAEAPVLDISGAKIGVNVSPEEVKSLPVNGRNFANLMTLATGATTDGNGGWASVRFNGKSNQQNYLNYDGVDGTYVWDANPGYLNATGSQFRLQTSMESVAEFRVNSGLAPAESGLGSGGNISVVTKSGGNRFSGSAFEYVRNDALDAANRYDGKTQELSLNQFGGSMGGPILLNRTFFFASFEGLRQDTGLSFTEAVPSDAARARILAGLPVGSGAGQSADRTRAVAPLLAGFPSGGEATSNALLSLYTLDTQATQRENTLSARLDHRITDMQTLSVRYLFSGGALDTPDRSVVPRRVRAEQTPQNAMVSLQSLYGTSMVNELKFGFNAPRTSARAFGPDGYPAEQVSLSGSVTSASIDARGSTGIARSGLQIRSSSAASGGGSVFDPMSLSISDALTWTRGRHTMKVGGEYRFIQSDFQFLGGVTYEFNSVNDFIDNRPNRVQFVADSPVFSPQQYYLIGFAQDSWRVSDRATLEMGLRYDFYSVVKEASGNARPFFVEENAFAADPNDFYNPDRNNLSPRLAATFQIDEKTVLRGGFGLFYGPGQFEDRIQPIENAIDRRQLGAGDVPGNGLMYPVPESLYRNSLSIRGYTRTRDDEYNVQYGVSVQRELPGAINLSVGYTGSRGKDMFLRGVANTYDLVTGVRPEPTFGQIDYKTSGCLDGTTIAGAAISGCGRAAYNAFQLSVTRRFRSGFTGGFQYQYATNRGTTQGSNEASTASNTYDFESEYGSNASDIRHSANGSLVYLFPGQGLWTGGWRVGGILNARSGVPINVTIARPDFVTANGVRIMNIPGGNSRGTQRPDLVPGVDPYLKDGVRWLNPAAFAAPKPGTFGNLPRNFLVGPAFWQVDMMVSKDFRFARTQMIQVRVEVFNLLNRLNYENPAAALPAGTPGAAFTDATAGTFGYMLGPLNRTVGLGTQRQTQVSVRYTF